MRVKLALLCAALCLFLSVCVPPAVAMKNAAVGAATACADALKSLGLFNGTDAGYELSRAPTRVEATAVLVRLLNKEQEALNGTWKYAFRDVPDWASSYVGYAYQNGIVNGTSATSFGSLEAMSSAMYLTLVLRALGYSDADGDFSWDAPFALAEDAGILPSTVDTADFMRGDVVLVSWSALSANLKGKQTTLSSRLIAEGAFTSSELASAQTLSQNVVKTSQGGGSGGGSGTSSDGKTILSNSMASVDVTNATDGYIRVAYTGTSSARLKAILKGPDGVQYTFDLTKGDYAVLPLTGGSGTYSVGVYVNVTGTKYSTAYSTSFKASLSSEFAPFLASNQYVNYSSSSKVVQLAAELTAKSKTDLDKIKAIYQYAVENISYDKDRAAKVLSGGLTGYIPDIDDVLKRGKGICFDYAAVMTAALRSLGIPTKLVIGYAEDIYHAWISTYTKESGWINDLIYFDGSVWKLMDPTFAAGGNEAYTADASHYSAQRTY